MSRNLDDPRDPAGEAPLTFPESWQKDSPDALSASVMFISGVIMITRNRYLAWPSLLLSINSVINQHPLRTKEGGNGTFTTILLAITAVVSTYLPLIMVQKTAQKQTPLPTGGS